MFLRRSFKKEIMDDFSINDERIDKALKELQVINRYLGGNSSTKRGIKKMLINIPSKKRINILDVGGGASDILLELNEGNFKIYSADLNKRITRYVKQNSPEVEIVCADAFNLPFKKKQFDLVHISLFLHHFTEDESKEILLKSADVSNYGIIINDLQRSVFAYTGIKILTALFSRSELVKNDGPLSVKRGFKKKEIIKMLNDLNFEFKINYRWAFRWLVVIYLNNE